MRGDEQGVSTVVIVDDNPDNLRVLEGILEGAGYHVRPALNGELALRSIEAKPPDLVMLDVRMPDPDGYAVCRMLKAAEATRDIPVIFVSALDDVEDKLKAFEAGAVDYVSKPFQTEEVLARVDAHIRIFTMKRDLDGQVALRTGELRKLNAALQHSEDRYRVIVEQTIQAMARMLEKRDPYTAGHEQRVAMLAVAIAKEMGFDQDRMEGLRMAATIHDIGKIYIPSELLNRPGRLTAVEFAVIKTHPEVGRDIVGQIEFPWPVGDMVFQHHERLDGSGYPLGLSGHEVLAESRILAVADVVEAMSAHRPYRPALGLQAALAEIVAGRGERYDEAAVDACGRLAEAGALDFLEQPASG